VTASDEPDSSREPTRSQRDNDSLIPQPVATLREQIRPALLSVSLLTFLTGVVFPLVLAALARPLFPHQAGGSLTIANGVVIGSELIGQDYSSPGYFHSRPSAAGHGYDAAASGGTNLAPANPRLRDGDASFEGVRALAEGYRRRNGLSPDSSVPVDAVTRSGSGLDPQISPANAALQVPRVARARRLSESEVRRLVVEHTFGCQFGILGEPRVRILPLNLALDRATPSTPSLSGR
jgi:K+-transporting ATPase ATPase C chain